MITRRVLLGVAILGWPLAAIADEATVDGAALFRRHCALCHGPDGRAATPAAKRLGARDLGTSGSSDEQMREVILEGVRAAGRAMPAFRGRLTDPELDALVAHLRSLRPAENPAKP